MRSRILADADASGVFAWCPKVRRSSRGRGTDWHFVPRDQCRLDGIDFEANLADVEKVQDDQLAIVRLLIREHGLKEVFSEGLSEETMPDLHLRLDLLKTLEHLDPQGDKETVRMKREFGLEVGIPGRLLHAGEIERVLPLEDAKVPKEARPIADAGGVRFDADKLDARRKAMAARLPDTGLALVVLGGSHDLGPHFGLDVLYVRVTPRSYPD